MTQIKKKELVRLTKKGDFKVTLSLNQLEHVVHLIDDLIETPRDNQDASHKLWNCVQDRLKLRFMSPVKYEAQTLTFKREEAIVICYSYFWTGDRFKGLESIMTDIHRKIQ